MSRRTTYFQHRSTFFPYSQGRDSYQTMAEKKEIDMPVDEAIHKASQSNITKSTKYHEIHGTTLKTPPHAYAHLEVISPANPGLTLDELTLRQYLTSALKQFLGVTGMGISIDLLKVSGRECWVRVPRQDLGALASALTAWVGSGSASGFRICAAGDWLGALVGRHEQRAIWGDS